MFVVDVKVKKGGKQGGNVENTKAARWHDGKIPDMGKTMVRYILNMFF